MALAVRFALHRRSHGKSNLVKKARKNVPDTDIKAGDSYYWWKFRFGGKRYSKTAPKRSQLTQSGFYSAIYSIEDDVIGQACADENLGDVRDDIVSQLEDLKSECEDSLSNIPDSLQEAPTGQLLQERIDALDSAIDEFNNLELDEPNDSDFDEFDEPERAEGQTEDDHAEEVEEARTAHVEEQTAQYWETKLEELQGISIEAP